MIGLYGGAFDPVHLGHLGVVEAAGRQVNLERIIFVPTGNPPHRGSPHASAGDRFRLLQAAVSDCDRCTVSDFEIRKPSKSWTIDTLKYFYHHHGQQTLCLIMGSDAFGGIDGWYRGDQILNYCHIMVVSRAGDHHRPGGATARYYEHHRVAQLPESLTVENDRPQGSILWIDAEVPDISSTLVRQRVRSGHELASLLPPAVEALIRDENIYRDENIHG